MEKNSLRLDNLLCKGFRLLLDFLSLAKAIELDRHLKKKLTSKGEIFLKKFFLLPSFFPPLHLDIFFFIRKTMAMNLFLVFFAVGSLSTLLFYLFYFFYYCFTFLSLTTPHCFCLSFPSLHISVNRLFYFYRCLSILNHLFGSRSRLSIIAFSWTFLFFFTPWNLSNFMYVLTLLI